MTRRTRILAAAALSLGLGAAFSGCGAQGSGPSADTTAIPAVGLCRNLTAKDLAAASNHDKTTPCADPHDAETYAAGPLPTKFAGAAYDDAAVANWAYQTCGTSLQKHLGANESLLMRSILTWVWFRPSETAWSQGARWYRCDVVGGEAPDYVDLPTSTLNLLRGKNLSDQWLACATGASVATGTKVPCSQPHDWRAVTTIKLGEPSTPYPGDAAVTSKTASYCESSVAAYLDYPKSFGYNYTWFGADEWAAGNRRSICWAETSS